MGLEQQQKEALGALQSQIDVVQCVQQYILLNALAPFGRDV